MRKRRLILVLLLLFLPFALFAENFTITGYDVDITIGDDRSYLITERIDTFFTSPSHGIYFDIPSEGAYDVEIVSVSDPYRAEKSGDLLSLTLGAGDKYISGAKTWEITYRFSEYADGYQDYDEFYYNIIGAWTVRMEDITFRVKFPSSIDSAGIYFTSGRQGSYTSDVTWELSGSTISGALDALNAGESLTLRVELPNGYFATAPVKKDYSFLALAMGILCFVLALVFILYLFHRYGKDEPLVVYPRFSPPEDLTPLEVGYLYDGVADNKDFSALIFYYADKGYLSIEETKKDKFTLTKLKESGDSFLISLFQKGDKVTLEQASLSLSFAIEKKLKPELEKKFSKGQCAIKSEESQRASTKSAIATLAYAVVMALLMSLNDIEMAMLLLFVEFFAAILFLLLSFQYFRKEFARGKAMKVINVIFMSLVAIICLLSAFGFAQAAELNSVCALALSILSVGGLWAFAMLASANEKRSPYGQKTMEEILGYRDFLDKVEVPELRALIDQDPEYYYHNLSFAIVFGLETKWASKFKSLYLPPASWYRGPYSACDYFFYASLSRRFNQSYARVIASQTGRAGGGRAGRTYSGFSGTAGGGAGGSRGGSW